MNTIEAKSVEVETVTVQRDSSGCVAMRTDAQGRHLFFVTGYVYNRDGTTSSGGIYVWAVSALDARRDGKYLYEEQDGRQLYVNQVYMPVH